MRKKKLALMTVTSMLAAALLVGAGTFALFTDKADNEGNTFESGTLELSTHRHDVPIEGPMFYTQDDDDGRMGTGLWAPRDTNTRAMFIKNTGSLDGKLTSLYAIPEGPNTADAEAFAEQAVVTVAVLEGPGGSDLAPKVIDLANHAFDAKYKGMMQFWLTRDLARNMQEFEADVRETFLNWTFEVNGYPFYVKDVYTGTLDGMMNNGAPALENLSLPSGETMYMAYTVTLPDHEDNNDIQGKEVKFTFKSEFTQAKNN